MACTTSLVVLQVTTAKFLALKVGTSNYSAHLTDMPCLPCLWWASSSKHGFDKQSLKNCVKKIIDISLK
jgi:hypothetical protein